MFALIIDAIGAYLLTQRITKWLYLVPLAVVVGITSAIVSTLALHYLWSDIVSEQEAVLMIFQGGIYHSLFCLICIWLLRREQAAKSSDIESKYLIFSKIKQVFSTVRLSKNRVILFLITCGITVFVVYVSFFQSKGYGDCIIDRMRGIQNDTAAQLVHKSCQKEYSLKEEVEKTSLKTWSEQQKNYDQCLLETLRDTRSKIAENYVSKACRKKFPRKFSILDTLIYEELPIENKNLISGNISVPQSDSLLISGKFHNENQNWRVKELILMISEKNSPASLLNTYPASANFIPYVESKYAIYDVNDIRALPTPAKIINNDASDTADFDSLGGIYADNYKKYLEASGMPSWICSAFPEDIKIQFFQGFVYKKDFISNYESINLWWTDKIQAKESSMIMLDGNIENAIPISNYETLSLLDPRKYPSLNKLPVIYFYKLKIDVSPKMSSSFSIYSNWPKEKSFEWAIYEARGEKL